jgi:hypothetical protein
MNEDLNKIIVIVDMEKELQNAFTLADPHPNLTENTTSTTLAELLDSKK